MDNKQKYIYLTSVKNNGNLIELNKLGVPYSDILSTLETDIESKIIKQDGSELVLTELGLAELEKVCAILEIDEQFLTPKLSAKLDSKLKLDIGEVYIPNVNELENLI